MFATDRDLLVLEPTAFRDLAWVGQLRARGTGSISGATLTLQPGPEADLVVGGVAAGSVAVVGEATYEVVARLGALTATVSRLRDADTDPARPPAPATDAAVSFPSLRPQIRLVHEQVLRMLGIDPEAAAAPGVVTAASVTNPRAMARLEALGALHLAFTAAAAPGGDQSPASWWSRALMYGERFAAERARVAAMIDLDGDGKPDAIRRPNVLQFVRG